MKLSKNLSLREAITSNTATKHSIDNSPNGDHILALVALAEDLFQPLREAMGVPIRISSGYRSPELNKRIGGASSPQHSKGEALDLQIIGKSKTNKDMFIYILRELNFDQLIWEFGDDNNPAWIHVSYKESGNRKQVLKASKVKGKTVYTVMNV